MTNSKKLLTELENYWQGRDLLSGTPKNYWQSSKTTDKVVTSRVGLQKTTDKVVTYRVGLQKTTDKVVTYRVGLMTNDTAETKKWGWKKIVINQLSTSSILWLNPTRCIL